jgi:hypothetical protein
MTLPPPTTLVPLAVSLVILLIAVACAYRAGWQSGYDTGYLWGEICEFNRHLSTKPREDA